jgi:hypothetical protein
MHFKMGLGTLISIKVSSWGHLGVGFPYLPTANHYARCNPGPCLMDVPNAYLFYGITRK